MTRVDPALRLDLLAKLQQVTLDGQGRSLFDFGAAPMADAAARFTWPREREALQHIAILLGTGDAGPAEDVLRVV